MIDTEAPNFPREARLLKCQALCAQLTAMRAKLATAQTDDDRQRCQLACAALEKDLAEAAGSPEQRALEAAQSELEGSLKDALLELATSRVFRGGEPQKSRVEAVEVQIAKLRALSIPQSGWCACRCGKAGHDAEVFRDTASPYTSEAEEKLAKLIEHLSGYREQLAEIRSRHRMDSQAWGAQQGIGAHRDRMALTDLVDGMVTILGAP